MPPIITAEQLAPFLGQTVAALANDRYRGSGPPFIKHGRRIRYLRADVARYLVAHRKLSA
ncbi:DNA-binding protein [Mycobacterium sp. ENV421]|nr:DNA-binding protein [Mycobacterium sp. ENV421]